MKTFEINPTYEIQCCYEPCMILWQKASSRCKVLDLSKIFLNTKSADTLDFRTCTYKVTVDFLKLDYLLWPMVGEVSNVRSSDTDTGTRHRSSDRPTFSLILKATKSLFCFILAEIVATHSLHQLKYVYRMRMCRFVATKCRIKAKQPLHRINNGGF